MGALVSIEAAAEALGVPELLVRNKITRGLLAVRGKVARVERKVGCRSVVNAVDLDEARAAVAAHTAAPAGRKPKQAKAPRRGVFEESHEPLCPITALAASAALLTPADRREIERRRAKRGAA